MTEISFEIQQQIIQCFGLCFHYKDTVVSFMQTSGVPNDLILKWKSEPKFVWAKNVINELNKTENGRLIISKWLITRPFNKNLPALRLADFYYLVLFFLQLSGNTSDQGISFFNSSSGTFSLGYLMSSFSRYVKYS